MQLALAIVGELQNYLNDIAKDVEKGSKRALRRATFGLRKDLRARVRQAGFRKRGLAKGIAGKVVGDEGRVYSVARYKGGRGRSGPVDLIQLFAEGARITAANGKWLAIPTGEGPRRSGRGGMRYATPAEMVAMGWKTAVIPSRHGGNMVVVAFISGAHYVTHVLIKQVTLRPRYDLDSSVAMWQEKLPSLVAEEIGNGQ